MKRIALSASLVALMTAPALANTAIGLAGDRTLVTIDLNSGMVSGMQDVQFDGRLHGIDFRPATNSLIAVTDGWDVVSLDPESGDWSLVVSLAEQIEFDEDHPVIVDINPVPDALRIMSGTENFRIMLDTGEVHADGALHFDDDTEGTPNIVATAYSNSFGSPDESQMFNLDLERAALLQQTDPNAGANVMIGETGVSFEGPVAFDIMTDEDGTNSGWISANGALHMVSLDDGSIIKTWEIEGLDVELRDMTVFAMPLDDLTHEQAELQTQPE